MKYINKYKILVIFLFIFLFFILSNNTSKATSDYYSFEDTNFGTIKYTIPSNASKYCISQYDVGFYCFVYTDNSDYSFAVRNENDTYKLVALYTSGDYSTQANYYRCHTSDNWALEPVFNDELNCYVLDFASCNSTLLENEVLYFSIFNTSNQTLINLDDNTTFFRLAPLEEITLVEMGKQATKKILPTILKVIATVVGLVIFLTALKTGFRTLVNGLKI